MRWFAIIFLFLILTKSNGQTNSGSMITLGIKQIDNHKKLNSTQLNILNNHLGYLATVNGMTGDANQENFILTSTFEVMQVQLTSNTLQPIHQATCFLTLTAKEALSGKSFATMNRRIIGAGLSEDLAINNALTVVDPESGDVKKFFEDSRIGIVNYYNSNCPNLIAKANTQGLSRKFLEAIHTLYGIPPEAKTCFDQAQPMILKAFNDYQKQECGSLILKAKAEASNFKFDKAVELISMVDPTGPCKDESRLFLKGLENKIDRENTKTWDLYNSLIELEMDANKAKFDAIKELMKFGITRPFGTLYASRSLTVSQENGELETIAKPIQASQSTNPRPSKQQQKPSSKQKAKPAIRYDEVPKIWAVIVGVADYENPKIPDLNFTINDANALAFFLESPEGGGLKRDQITYLGGENATRSKIMQSITEIFNQAYESDLIMFYFSGHGAPDASGKEVYFLPFDTDPENLEGSAVSQLDIQKIIGKSRAEKKIIIVDACHSGGIGTDLGKKDAMGDASIINRLLEQIAYSDKSTAILTASSSSEKSIERKDFGKGHGVFTYFLIEGLKGKANTDQNNFVSIRELYEYTYRNVTGATKGKQHPEIKGNFDNNLPLSVIRNLEPLRNKR